MQPQLLDNKIEQTDMPFQEEIEMAKINRAVTIDGVKKWIRANTEQEYAEKLIALCQPVQAKDVPHKKKHRFDDYALTWFEIYGRPHLATVTATTYQRQIGLYLLPAFGSMSIEDITPDDIQRLFNGMDTAKATKDKVKLVLNQILDAAVEDDIIVKSPRRSNKVRITGKESQTTVPYTVSQMQYLVSHLDNIEKPQDRTYMALQALHPLRLEEVLGLKWGDIDLDNLSLRICRAVTHPNRNMPEVKSPKTKSSVRIIGLSSIAAAYLSPGPQNDFVVGGKNPMSYTQVRRMCIRIKRDTGFDENITPIRFRTTVLTDLYDQTKDIKLAQAAAGHTTSAMTLRYYVKGREETIRAAGVVDDVYGK